VWGTRGGNCKLSSTAKEKEEGVKRRGASTISVGKNAEVVRFIAEGPFQRPKLHHPGLRTTQLETVRKKSAPSRRGEQPQTSKGTRGRSGRLFPSTAGGGGGLSLKGRGSEATSEGTKKTKSVSPELKGKGSSGLAPLGLASETS